MTKLGPELQALKAELGHVIRRDLNRHRRRRKIIRTSALTFGVLLLLAGSALAAGNAFGVIELSGGVSATRVSSAPEWSGDTGTFVNGDVGGAYIYHLTGGIDPNLGCGPTDSEPTNNIYVTSTRPLVSAELGEILSEELNHEATPWQISAEEIKEGKLPAGARWSRKGRYPVVSGSANVVSAPKLLAGVTSISNGCPTPGVAGQPGTPGSAPASGQAGVAVAPSNSGIGANP